MTIRKLLAMLRKKLGKNSKVMPSNHYLNAVVILVPYTTVMGNAAQQKI